MMNGSGIGFGGEWIMMIIVWAGLIGLAVFAISRLVGRGARTTDARPAAPGDASTREILDRRLARGEIDPDTHRAVVERLAQGAGR